MKWSEAKAILLEKYYRQIPMHKDIVNRIRQVASYRNNPLVRMVKRTYLICEGIEREPGKKGFITEEGHVGVLVDLLYANGKTDSFIVYYNICPSTPGKMDSDHWEEGIDMAWRLPNATESLVLAMEEEEMKARAREGAE